MLGAELKAARDIVSQMNLFESSAHPPFSGFSDLSLTNYRALPLLKIVHLKVIYILFTCSQHN
jgi:hypothetical protein